ncbi:CMRF35-like molecule 6 [Alosa sapidissima]|uniref:CMRF35-like molecule 6 n=1 Tax=Alosa sapidissima TaxID=34773 RepID=UPI001C08F8FE|nr:CMRF35-like molecule 6 [Alosa sapidissima]
MGDYEALITNVQLTSTSCMNTINMTGLFEGDTANISCPYPRGYEDKEKFFCREESPVRGCVDQITVKKTSTWLVNGMFSAFDDDVTRNFKVEMKGLTAEDSGIYWCVFDRKWKPANYTRFILFVGVYLVVPVSLSVTALIIIIIIIIWRCKRKMTHE